MGKDAELVDAAREGNYPLCEKLLSSKPKRPGPFASLRKGNGGGTNCRDSAGYTALHYSALNGYKDIVELLLTYEASCNSGDQKGSSPLHLAAWAGRSEIVGILLTHGPSIANSNLTNADQETALHSASQYGHLECVDLLLKHGADPNIKNAKDETPLDLAAQYGRVETTSLLLRLHPELVCPYTAYGGTLYRHTPLHLASSNGHKEVVELVLKAGFDINVRTPRGTALHEAAICGKINVVEILLEENINSGLQDQNGKTVIDVMNDIKTSRSREIIKIILEHGGNLLSNPSHEDASTSQALDTYSLDLDLDGLSGTGASSSSFNPIDSSRTSGEQRLRPRSAKSVEDIVDRRISTLSTMSGCSDCTTTTLQDEEESSSSVFHRDTASLSSGGSVRSSSCRVEEEGEEDERKNRTLTREPPAKPNKPAVPAKPAHIRPGLKPVKIPKIHDKISVSPLEAGVSVGDAPPPKPPRRNVSVSPIRKEIPTEVNNEAEEAIPGGAMRMALSSKSYEELDDILRETAVLSDSINQMKETAGSHIEDTEQKPSSNASNADQISRHSCDELMMTRSFHEGETSDTSSQLSSDCQRCLLNSITNRTMSLDCEGFWTPLGQNRLISQRQYKRKLKRETPSYVTLERRRSDKKSAPKPSKNDEGSDGTDTIKVSKTTYKLESQHQEPESLELMEIPTSPTNYDQPSTPDTDPPSPARAEEEIARVLERLSSEAKRCKRSKGTEIEEAYLLPLGKRDPDENQKLPVLQSIGVGPGSGSRAMELDIADEPEVKDKVLGKEDSTSVSSSHTNNDSAEATRTSSILSPFDEKDEWLKISQIIDSFGTDIVGVDADAKMTEEDDDQKNEGCSPDSSQYQTWKRQEKVLNSVPEWLQYISCIQYTENFDVNGYDHLDFIGENFISKEDLLDMGIKNEKDCLHILESLQSLKLSPEIKEAEKDSSKEIHADSVDNWLKSLNLAEYAENFGVKGYSDMNRVKSVWDEELRTLIGIHKKGHRKRILMSLATLTDDSSTISKSGFTAIDNRCKPPPQQPVKSPSCSGNDNKSIKKKKKSEEDDKSISPPKTPPAKTLPPPKLLKSKTTLMGRESLNLSGSGILSTTLGRRKKKPAPPAPSELSTQSAKKSTKEEKQYLSYGVKYFGKKSVKDFKGNDSTKQAIEQIRRAKAGRLRYVLISDKTVTAIKRDTKEPVEVHNIENICCVVHDKEDPRILGYISNDGQKYTHVFSTDCKEKTSEILSAICEGYADMKARAKFQDPLLPPTSAGSSAGSGAENKPSSPPSPVAKSKSDFLVSRMKLFFQGSSSSSGTDSASPTVAAGVSNLPSKQQEARRKRGGSVDDLIDRLDEPLTNESRMKSASTKNLNAAGSLNSSTSSSTKTTVEEVKITTV